VSTGIVITEDKSGHLAGFSPVPVCIRSYLPSYPGFVTAWEIGRISKTVTICPGNATTTDLMEVICA